MAIGEHKRKSPYHGIWIVSILMMVVPVCAYILMHVAIFKWQPKVSAELNEASAKVLGFGIGLLFHLGLVISGIFGESFRVVLSRVKGFFEDLKFSFKIAWQCYVEHIREHGVAFWIVFVIMCVNFCFFWSGMSYMITYYAL